MRLKFVSFSNLTLLVALALSSVAAYYSIIGLTAIFAGAVIPVIIMGSILEVAKITTTVWLRKYWKRAGWWLKVYLVPAVIALALLTSMGIFGFLSKAHMDQGVTTGDSQAKLSLYDEKIKTQRDNIELARKALTQMDAQVDQMLGRTDSDKGAERAVAIRKQQAKERASLQNDIGVAQKEIQKLNEERAPIAAENRKVEAEVGPIKYIAALIYGDNADQNMLESAVRWVIILLVIVFDPLAIALVLAANQSKDWDKEEIEDDTLPTPMYEPDNGPLTTEQVEQIEESVEQTPNELTTTSSLFEDAPTHCYKCNSELVQAPEIGIFCPNKECDVINNINGEARTENDPSLLSKHPYLDVPFKHFENTTPIVAETEKVEVPEEVIHAYDDERLVSNMDKKILAGGVDSDRPGDYLMTADSNMPVPPDVPYKTDGTGYVNFEGKRMSMDALKGMRPDLFGLAVDYEKAVNSGFGTKFPEIANKGDIFVRVDVLPNKVYKFDSRNWIQTNKEISSTYLYNTKYVEYLIDKLAKGEYDAELLSENERIQIEDYLKIQKNNENKNG